MPTLRNAVERLQDRWLLPPSGTVSVKDLLQRFKPVPSTSLQSLLTKMNMLADTAEPVGGSTRPYYQRAKPQPSSATAFAIDRIDLRTAHLPPYAVPDASGTLPDVVPAANKLLDARTAAAVKAAVGEPSRVSVFPNWPAGEDSHDFNALLERKVYDDGPSLIYLMTAKCLPAMAYKDYFPLDALGQPDPVGQHLRDLVSQAIIGAWPGWCGSFGPGITGLFDLAFGDPPSGDYDMNEMHILPLIYGYYEDLLPAAREKLITELLKNGQMQRPNRDPTYTSGGTPNDWRRAGYISPLGAHFNIPETENHVLMIASARYLTNQLLYQRSPEAIYDNRRNGDAEDSRPTCTEQLLYLMRAMLLDDFGEYNSKPYQAETRRALTNLCSYAYDHEVRLAARMVLDYISAHYVVSSNDLRRLLPFRRRQNENDNAKRFGFEDAFMAVGLLGGGEQVGADVMSPYFALLAGNTRGYETTRSGWGIDADAGSDVTQEALGTYRLPPSVHDLFVNDQHRRFFQRLHRTDRDLDGLNQRNCDNREIFAGSPSYLITAGGRPATWVIPGRLGVFGYKDQNIGVAVTTSFMPTGSAPDINHIDAKDLIQFGRFSNTPDDPDDEGSENYGVAPDFAAGALISLPAWVERLKDPHNPGLGSFYFVNKRGMTGRPGFYLAIYQRNDFAMMEAFDTWLHPLVPYDLFKQRVVAANADRTFACNQECIYTTQNGNQVHFIVWNDGNTDGHHEGARITSIEYGNGKLPNTLPDASRRDTLVDAGQDEGRFLSGTIMVSPEDGLVMITNPDLQTTITLDMRDQSRPKRISEDGEVAMAADNTGRPQEVWVNFGWKGPCEGDVFRPFKTITAAAAAVAEGGVINIMPGWTNERPVLSHKRMRLVAPIGGVSFGIR